MCCGVRAGVLEEVTSRASPLGELYQKYLFELLSTVVGFLGLRDDRLRTPVDLDGDRRDCRIGRTGDMLSVREATECK
jgi:hypothetical protein